MKKVTFAAFVAFWAGIVVIFGIGQIASDRAAADEDALSTITLEQLAEHDHDESCWMAIEGRVYDFTDYIPQHPAPPAIILAWCGREATEGMRTKGYGRDHSPPAWAMMDDYLIGVLAED